MRIVFVPAGGLAYGLAPTRIATSVFSVYRSLHGWIPHQWSEATAEGAAVRARCAAIIDALAPVRSDKVLISPHLWKDEMADGDELIVRHAHGLCLDAPFAAESARAVEAWEAAPLSVYAASSEHLRHLAAAFRIRLLHPKQI